MTTKGRPPFRADHVGSLLRTKEVHEARAQFANHEITAEGLRAVENEHIKNVVKLQEDIGMGGVTDGEYRRAFFHIDFLKLIDGVTATDGGGLPVTFHSHTNDLQFKPPRLRVDGKLVRSKGIATEDFKYLKSVVSKGVPKLCIPSPTMLHFRGGRSGVSEEAYPDMDEFFDDLQRVYREEVAELGKLGCTYLQLDDTNLAYLCDPHMRENAKKIGEDPDKLPSQYADVINQSIKSRPDDMAVCVHLCRGNFRSAWVAEGGYEPVAEAMLNELEIDGFFLEYDDDRSGDFEPLRFLPKGKIVILGLVSSKLGELESKDEIKRRIDEAAKFAPIEQLALSPQCGFASTQGGNEVSFDQQRAKLEFVQEIAQEVWG